MLRIFDSETGDVLFEYMTNREFPDTVNGVAGHGGGRDGQRGRRPGRGARR